MVNAARVRSLRRLLAVCGKTFADFGLPPPEVLLTSADDPGTGMAAAAVRGGAAVVFAVGGDGTVRACAQALAGTAVPLAVVPAGSANLTASALGVPAGMARALQVGLAGEVRQIDLAVADGMTCVAMAGIGLDAAVVGAAPAQLRQHAGWLGYAAAAVPRLAGASAGFTLRLDGGPPLARRARSVAVGNVGLLPGGFLLLPDARLDDGLLDTAILAPSGLAGWVSVGIRVLGRSRHDDHHLERYQAREVEIGSDAELARQVDGEVIAPGRSLSVTVRPGALRVMVPRSPAIVAR